ncbi:hypothetical protein SDC9_133846 [bioreactor metagenome]|uniref:Uncharacterized protein n=1 Tax=bioreactor metagenome TaxID=1076179 RepID=A0A645DBM6_9ZZZZ
MIAVAKTFCGNGDKPAAAQGKAVLGKAPHQARIDDKRAVELQKMPLLQNGRAVFRKLLPDGSAEHLITAFQTECHRVRPVFADAKVRQPDNPQTVGGLYGKGLLLGKVCF